MILIPIYKLLWLPAHMRQTIRVLSSRSQTARDSRKASRDFFGITDITSKDVAGSFSSELKLGHQDVSIKYDSLIQSRKKLDNEDRDVDKIFGRVRFDKDNIIKRHGQYDPGNAQKLHDTVEITQRFVSEDRIESSVAQDKIVEKESSDSVACNIGNPAYKISEVEPIKDIHDVFQMLKIPNVTKALIKYANKSPLTFYFEDELIISPKKTVFDRRKRSTEDDIKSETIQQLEETIQNLKPKTLEELEAQYQKEGIPLHELDPMSDEFQYHFEKSQADFEFDASLDEKYDAKGEINHQNALSHLKQIRAKKIEPTAKGLKHRLNSVERPYSLKPHIKLDSRGFNDYSHQVPDWNSCRRVDVLNHLKESIIYNNYDILAINKPYGIASHNEDRRKSRKEFDMNSLVQEIATTMRIDKVYLAHRLDKTTTGVLLFATSRERADKLNKLFKSDEIKKTYLCITKGIPEQEAALIDIPIGTFNVAGKSRSCPVPESLDGRFQMVKKFREARRALTEYKVLNATDHIAVVEVKPRSGVKHQIRCHLGFGLNTPILGDHKYSHLGKLAPQKLDPSTLKALHLRQEKVRTLPVHLHASTIVIPGAKANGETLFITAPLPLHFVDNMKRLGVYNESYKKVS